MLRGCKQRLAERDTRHAAAAAVATAAAAPAPAVAAGLGVNGATRVAPVFSREGTSGQKKMLLLLLLFICEREQDFQHALARFHLSGRE